MSAPTPTASRSSGWFGWIMFAAVIMILNGTMTAIQGLAGIFRDEVYFVPNGVLVLDLTAWGWIHLILGIAMILIGAGLLSGSFVAQWLTLLVVGFNMIGQFAWIGAYPWWSLIVIAIDLLIFYAIIVHGVEAEPDY
jgi:hypothetical protein